jgi:hypothetical protein
VRRTEGRRRCAVAVGVAILSAIAPVRLTAQDSTWQRSADLSANAWYGAAHTRVVSSQIDLGRTDSSLSVRASFRFSYADDRDADGPRQVTARGGQLSLGIDYRPYDRWSPFVFGGSETSYQQRIARRDNVGAGAKRTLRRKGRDDLSISLALLAERTRALVPHDSIAGVDARARWSLRFRYRRQLTHTLYFSHVTFYQPGVRLPLAQYTIDATTAVEASITSVVSLTATLRDRYDSEARQRGADSDNDGNFLFGLRAHF